MGLGIPPLESNPLKSAMLVGRLGVHPVPITRFSLTRLVPRVGLPRNRCLIGSLIAALRFSKGWVRKKLNLVMGIGCTLLRGGETFPSVAAQQTPTKQTPTETCPMRDNAGAIGWGTMSCFSLSFPLNISRTIIVCSVGVCWAMKVRGHP